MNDRMGWKNTTVAVVGGVVGGVVGHFAAWWIALHGIYALVLPGATLGLGAGLLVQDRSVLRGVLCAVAAVALGFFTGWRSAPFAIDDTLGYYFAHVHKLPPMFLLTVAAGGACAYWLAVGKERVSPNPVAGPDPRRAG